MNKIENQHGDLLLVKVESVPCEAKKLNVGNGYILERGEGVHTHVLDDVSNVDVFEKDGNIYVKVKKLSTINHEEHGPQTLKPGIYRKAIERVFDYEAMEARRVID